MGVGWGAVRNGISDVGGVPAAVLRTFSKRRAEVQARLDERGLSSPRAAEVATLDTRRRKTHTVEGGVLAGTDGAPRPSTTVLVPPSTPPSSVGVRRRI